MTLVLVDCLLHGNYLKLIAALFFIGAVVHMRRRKMEKLSALGGDEDDERGHFVSNPGLSTVRRQRLREIANYNG